MYKGGKIAIIDNTGIKTVKILQVYRHRAIRPGDICLAVIWKKKKIKKYVKKKIYNIFIICRWLGFFRRKGHVYVWLVRNQALVLGADNEKILGTRHKGYLTLESWKRAFSQLVRSCRVVI